MDKICHYLDKIEVLPPSPTLLPKLLPKLSDLDANFDEVVGIIAVDPALTSKLLQICNSAYFGHESEVSSVADAVQRIGYQAVYLLVAMINGSACFTATAPGGVDAAKLWRHSVFTAFNAKFVAESAGADGSLLFTAGLLHDLGKVILGRESLPAPDLFRLPSDPASLARETEFFGVTHAELGAALLERWKLPAPIVAAVRHHHEPMQPSGLDRFAACVAVGNFVAHSQEHPESRQRPELDATLAQLGLSREHVQRWNERLRDHQSLVTGMSRLPL